MPPFAPDDIDRLARPRHEDLLKALLSAAEFRYTDLAEATGRSVNAITTQFNRWDQQGLLLRERSGKAEADGPGKPPALFRLLPHARTAIEQALELIASDRAETERPEVDWLPRLDGLTEMVEQALDAARALSVRYYSASSGARRFAETQQQLQRDPRDLGYQPSARLLAAVEERRRTAERYAAIVRREIERKPDDLKDNARKLKADLAGNSRPEAYFSYMKSRSVSGYGGAMLARADGPPSNALDVFLADAFAENTVIGQRMQSGFSHALSEIVELTQIVEDWSPTALAVFTGAEMSVPLAALPAMRDAAGRGFRAIRFSAVDGGQTRTQTAQNALRERLHEIETAYRPRADGISFAISGASFGDEGDEEGDPLSGTLWSASEPSEVPAGVLAMLDDYRIPS